MNKNNMAQQPDPHTHYKNAVPRERKPPVPLRKKLLRSGITLFAWVGLAMIYYVGFSFFFDTPVEYRMKQTTRQLRQEYNRLDRRYDSLQVVMKSVVERDRGVFRALFESDPYDFGAEAQRRRWESHEAMLKKSNKNLAQDFFAKLGTFQRDITREQNARGALDAKMDSLGEIMNYLPAIQPVLNPDLTLLTASYGMRIHPFYKSLAAHQGVDFTVAEGSRVFATADGWVSEVSTRRTTSGNTVVIDHGIGYETVYSHLDKIYVRRGQAVRRGDIIAQSGNTGLSLAPHLHYEVRHNGMRVDPVHYFFLELNYNQYEKIIKIAQSGMQSFD